ncbi:carbohydrate-binding module family 18 protein, partial [Lophiostoma macrostomum CBS 122681]
MAISPNGLCGPTFMYTCQDSMFGQCCSRVGRCGNDAVSCGAGCRSQYGVC